ncbi:MAG: isoleucine--tRNA ligase [Alphaproteobacteria bacterium]
MTSLDYKSTIRLPQTDFPMKAGLPAKEPEILAHWVKIDLWDRLRKDSKGREKFVLHDGPPYANGHLHIGHALNKILKDVVSRAQQMLGKDSIYVPGWDCHGLPIEWKIEEQYREAGKNKDEVPVLEFRKECRDFAAHWIDIQREEFKRLGVIGDWNNPYATMHFAAEAQILREIHKFALNGGLYRGERPVLWSVAERTALADAEVEYHDHVSPSIFVKFPVRTAGGDSAEVLLKPGDSIVIWTTTPWTIPGNRALAYTTDAVYGLYQVETVNEKSPLKVGERLVVADTLAEAIRKVGHIESWKRIDTVTIDRLAMTVCDHPLRGQGYDFAVRLFHGDFVTTDQGTGFVHIAPGGGEDDWRLGRANDLEIPATIDEDSIFYDYVPLFAGKRVLTPAGKEGDANAAVTDALREAGALLGGYKLTHSYPHSWRSKAPLLFRTTAQWFISMEANGLRDKALASIEATSFYPPQGRNRLHGMIAQRPDWCVSRQRTWGVPIAIFMHKKTGKILGDPEVLKRIADAFETEGGDAWFKDNPARFLTPSYDPEEWQPIRDIIEVWFESGSSHAFVLEQRPDLIWPASLYLEGSDQHRGWFHSSLLEACGTRGRAPFDAVLTHGFVLDEQGRKMSKSIGNVVAPQEVIKEHGADILRLWVVGSDYSEDLRIGPEILKHHVDLYRRIRNTFRYLLGNLSGFSETERVSIAAMPELERWVLHRLVELDALVRKAVTEYDFHRLATAVHNFCTSDLSAFYFDIRKDSLYCDALMAPRRRACRTVLDTVFSYLTAWLAPVLCFTTEEAWLARLGADRAAQDSVHLRLFPDVPTVWRDDALAAKWEKVRNLRRVVTGALEKERAEKRIGSSLAASPHVYADAAYIGACQGLDLAEICIVSALTLDQGTGPQESFTLVDVPGVAVVPTPAPGAKCARCWTVLPEVGSHPKVPGVCLRCGDAIQQES